MTALFQMKVLLPNFVLPLVHAAVMRWEEVHPFVKAIASSSLGMKRMNSAHRVATGFAPQVR
jgi:hypothetical protein